MVYVHNTRTCCLVWYHLVPIIAHEPLKWRVLLLHMPVLQLWQLALCQLGRVSKECCCCYVNNHVHPDLLYVTVARLLWALETRTRMVVLTFRSLPTISGTMRRSYGWRLRNWTSMKMVWVMWQSHDASCLATPWAYSHLVLVAKLRGLCNSCDNHVDQSNCSLRHTTQPFAPMWPYVSEFYWPKSLSRVCCQNPAGLQPILKRQYCTISIFGLLLKLDVIQYIGSHHSYVLGMACLHWKVLAVVQLIAHMTSCECSRQETKASYSIVWGHMTITCMKSHVSHMTNTFLFQVKLTGKNWGGHWPG